MDYPGNTSGDFEPRCIYCNEYVSHREHKIETPEERVARREARRQLQARLVAVAQERIANETPEDRARQRAAMERL